MKKYLYLLSTVSVALIIGCGDGSSVSDHEFNYDTSSIFGFSKEISYKNYVIKAVDDPVVHATVKATNCEGYKEIGNGEYLLTKCIAKPSYIEIKDGIIKVGDKNISQDFPLLLNVSQSNKDDDFIVTPLTTILVNADEGNISLLADSLGINKNELYGSNNDKVKKLFPKINSILITANSQGVVTNKIKFLDVVKNEVINEIENNGDINTIEILKNISKKSITNPNVFGLVILNDVNIDNNDPLETLAKIQNAKKIRLYGLVFDSKIENANIRVIDLDTHVDFGDIQAQSDENGAWSLTIDQNGSLYNTIMNKNHLLQFIATKKYLNKNIKLTSTITTSRLRKLIKNSKVVSPSKDNKLIISNITTAQDAILDKKGALNSISYDGNLSELRVYYQDKIIQAAAIVKSVVDENVSVKTNVDNTYDLIKNSISNIDNVDIKIDTTKVINLDKNKLSSIENSIINHTILSYQLNDISNDNMANSDDGKKSNFQRAAQKANYTFYRVLMYFKENQPKIDDNFVREYDKIIVYPSYYEIKTCYLYGYSTNDWKCIKNKVIKDNSNFTLGSYEINENNKTIIYNLDFSKSFYVKELNKNYGLYGVIKSEINLDTGVTKTEPMILIDSYDVVDAVRRLPNESRKEFNAIKEALKKYDSKTEINYELNRWIKQFINYVDNYFNENNK